MKPTALKKLVYTIIRVMAIILLVLAMVIATMTYSVAPSLGPEAQEFFYKIYLYFENYFRAITVVIGCALTWWLLSRTRRAASPQYKRTLIAFSVVVMIVLVLFPLITGYYDLYSALMPFPWSTLPFQLADNGNFFNHPFESFHGIDGGFFILLVYVLYQAMVYGGTLFLGRRWQCSMLCLLNGCHAESMGIALPLVAHHPKRKESKQVRPALVKALRIFQLVLFGVNLLLVAAWVVLLVARPQGISRDTLIQIERIKYLSVELTLMMGLWLVISARGYCYYCPAGFALGIVGNFVGQRIETNLTHCTQCGACNDACKLSIDIQGFALRKEPVRALQCVGCTLCVSACPTKNLKYTTHFLSWQESRKTK
ncbi:MAG: hypothetical protein JXR70_15185 [Spirochaetales bacterium]|nr:hypothetical protein [Spirochaetales bacterium]